MSNNEMTQAELAKINAEFAKQIAETSQINSESRWYPLVVSSGLLGAGIAIATVFIKLI